MTRKRPGPQSPRFSHSSTSDRPLEDWPVRGRYQKDIKIKKKKVFPTIFAIPENPKSWNSRTTCKSATCSSDCSNFREENWNPLYWKKNSWANFSLTWEMWSSIYCKNEEQTFKTPSGSKFFLVFSLRACFCDTWIIKALLGNIGAHPLYSLKWVLTTFYGQLEVYL